MKFYRSVSMLSLAAALCASVGVVTLAVAGQEKAAAPAKAVSEQSGDPLKLLEPYIGGQWKCTGAWSNGEKLIAREVYTWGPGKKFVNVKTYLTGPDGEYQRYEGMYGVKDGKLVSWSFAYDGTVDFVEWTVDGRKWSVVQNRTSADGSPIAVHQTIEMVEPDRFRWVLEVESGGKKQTMFDGFWVREEGSSASAK